MGDAYDSFSHAVPIFDPFSDLRFTDEGVDIRFNFLKIGFLNSNLV